MKELKGTIIDKLPFELIKQGDIVYYEGPLESHFIDENGNNYLMLWHDINKTVDRCILFKVNDNSFKEYIFGEISLYDLIQKEETVYIIDINNSEYVSIINVEINEIVDLPSIDSYLNEELMESYAKNLLKEYDKDNSSL